MVLHHFINQIFGKRQKEVVEPKKEKISFENLKDWIRNKEKENKENEEEITILIKEKISMFVKDMTQKVNDLEDYNVDAVNSEKRINAVVKSGQTGYVNHIRGLLQNMEKINENELDQIIEKIKYLFLDFDKRTSLHYQRAAFLIKDEVEEVHKGIIDFSKFYTKTLEENKEIIESINILRNIKQKVEEIHKTNTNIIDINKKIKDITKEITNTTENNKKWSDEIEIIRKIENFVQNIKLKEQIESEEKQLTNEISKVKQNIDFKELSNLFHSHGKKMGIIKEHRDYFEDSILKDNGEEIIELLLEAKLDTNSTSQRIKEIISKKHEISKDKSQIKPDETIEISNKISHGEIKIKNLNNEKEDEQKRKKKFESEKKEILNSLKEELEKVNVVLSE
jgi:hypothetical protein